MEEIRVNAAIQEIALQRNASMDRAAQLAGEVAVLQARIASIMEESAKVNADANRE